MKEYVDYIRDIYENGHTDDNRTNNPARKVFGRMMRFDLTECKFPLVQAKFTPIKNIARELLWFISGDTNNETLAEQGCHIWDNWAVEDGDLGPIYGKQWRDFGVPGSLISVDQINELIEGLREKPLSRRHIVNAWNPTVLPNEKYSPQENVKMGLQSLAPCHALFQCHVRTLKLADHNRYITGRMRELGIEFNPLEDTVANMQPETETILRETIFKDNIDYFDQWLNYCRKEYPKSRLRSVIFHQLSNMGQIPQYGLSLQLYQRSCDSPAGVPFNIASYAMLNIMLARLVGMAPLEFIWMGGDCHIYENQIEAVEEMLARPLVETTPYLILPEHTRNYTHLEDFKLDDITCVTNYHPHPKIEVAISI